MICQKVLPRQIEKLTKRVAQHKARASEYLLVLSAIVKVEEFDLPLKRNQDYVMKNIFTHLNDITYMMKQPQAVRLGMSPGVPPSNMKTCCVATRRCTSNPAHTHAHMHTCTHTHTHTHTHTRQQQNCQCGPTSLSVLLKSLRRGVVFCRQEILRKEENTDELMYYVRLVDLLACCAEVRIS